MGDEAERLNETEWEFLRGELMGLLAERFTQGDSSSNGGAQDLQASVNRQIQFFVENLGEKRIPAFKTDANVVSRVRELLIVPVTALTVYNKGIKRQGLAKMPGSFSVASAMGSGSSGLFGKDQPVPNLFTQAGWEKFAKEAIVQESQDPGREDWVLGNKQRQLSDEVKNPDLLAEKLRGFYFNEYIRVWQQFLQSLQYENFPDLRTAGERLKTLSDPGNSPLKALLEKASVELSFDEALKSIISGGAKKIGVELAKHPVDRAFVGLHTFISGGADSPLTAVLGQFAGAAGELEELAGDPTGMKAKDYAAKVVQSESGELPKALKEIRKILNKQDVPSQQVLKNLFDKPLQSAWGTVLGSAYGYLNSQRQCKVY
jgi:type VI protein secretion system component VasK